ncbi:hypothetical protein BCR44DRAFT_315545 [Catenaria anguillulae PL171]|uniref:Uncharacterized protein n=1 Tax=Catenaria anguillulae PL171 TaxID=765915 RepID=A0A1Y2HXT2_9FUNG|nr:hypothetical protein BCR44DRAFT_315545 [Catenaria anguillulae PL171]
MLRRRRPKQRSRPCIRRLPQGPPQCRRVKCIQLNRLNGPMPRIRHRRRERRNRLIHPGKPPRSSRIHRQGRRQWLSRTRRRSDRHIHLPGKRSRRSSNSSIRGRRNHREGAVGITECEVAHRGGSLAHIRVHFQGELSRCNVRLAIGHETQCTYADMIIVGHKPNDFYAIPLIHNTLGSRNGQQA